MKTLTIEQLEKLQRSVVASSDDHGEIVAAWLLRAMCAELLEQHCLAAGCTKLPMRAAFCEEHNTKVPPDTIATPGAIAVGEDSAMLSPESSRPQELLTSNPNSAETQRREAFANFLAALDAKDIPMSMAATFQAGWDAAMRRPRPSHETGVRCVCGEYHFDPRTDATLAHIANTVHRKNGPCYQVEQRAELKASAGPCAGCGTTTERHLLGCPSNGNPQS